MTNATGSIDEDALGWVIRLREPAFDDWEGFETWLGADPAHAQAYHAMAVADEDIGTLLTSSPSRTMPEPLLQPAVRRVPLSRRGWIGGAVAASLVAVTGYGWMTTRADPYQIATAPGAHRTVALADGTRIDLNGSTTLTLDRNRPRYASVDTGEALFTVVHDPARPFTVTVGGATLRDVGTVFNVVRDADETRVAVSEGAVIYNPDAEAVQLPAGKALRAHDGDAPIEVSAIAPDSVAGWRDGKLIYDGAPLVEVAADITRLLGVPLQAAPEVAARPIRGIITIGSGDKAATIRSLGPLLDVGVSRRGQLWVLTAKGP